MGDFFRGLLATDGFHPHGYCYLWRSELIALHVISDALIGLAYVAIGMTLALFVRRGRGVLPFSRIFVAFGVFIAACGATHFVEIWTLWTPAYWMAGSVKVVTAAASVLTALALPPLVPVALGTIRSARISEQRREELERTNAELASAHRELEQLYQRLKEADEARTRFFANVSHELRTPLALILGPADQMAQDPALHPDHRQRAEGMVRNATLLLRQVNDLLDLQKLRAAETELDYARVDLASNTRFWGDHFDSVALSRGIHLSLQVPDALPAEIDPDKIARVVFNLLGNALKFTPDGGRIRCVLRPASDNEERDAERRPAVVLEVHDSGPGIPAEQRERVFEPFRQAGDTATRRFGGTGLGLAIVRDLVRLHGGTVTIHDSPEGGALFRVVLPIRAPEDARVQQDRPVGHPIPSPDLPAAPLMVADAAGSATGDEPDPAADDERPLVLVVEDNPEMNRFIREGLAGEYRTIAAFDGRAGLEAARRHAPDLVLSDIMMPSLSGADLVRELRSVPELESVPVILLSARADDMLRVQLLNTGAQDYLTKPFAVDELRARVRNWVSIKRVRDLLRRELDTTAGDVEMLTRELAQRGRELDAALSDTRVALVNAEQANRAKSEFLGVMSHELRTPLNAIVGYADLLALAGDTSISLQQQQYVHRILSNASHLLKLIEEILEYTRIEAGHDTFRSEPLNLADLVRETVELLSNLAAQKQLPIRLLAPEDPIIIRSDPQKIRQIVLNLVGNAIKFTDSGEITVAIHPGPRGAQVRVVDSGPGIAPEHLERVFDPFWQVDATHTRRFGGTGLGLSITRRLAELLGGRVQVQSEVGVGSEFLVWLPPEAPLRTSQPAGPGIP
jgi:signal transduction histidine kinase